MWASVFSLFFDCTTRPPFSLFCFSFRVLFLLLFIHGRASVYSLFFDFFATRPLFSLFCFNCPVLFLLLFIRCRASVFGFSVLVTLCCFGCCFIFCSLFVLNLFWEGSYRVFSLLVPCSYTVLYRILSWWLSLFFGIVPYCFRFFKVSIQLYTGPV